MLSSDAKSSRGPRPVTVAAAAMLWCTVAQHSDHHIHLRERRPTRRAAGASADGAAARTTNQSRCTPLVRRCGAWAGACEHGSNGTSSQATGECTGGAQAGRRPITIGATACHAQPTVTVQRRTPPVQRAAAASNPAAREYDGAVRPSSIGESGFVHATQFSFFFTNWGTSESFQGMHATQFSFFFINWALLSDFREGQIPLWQVRARAVQHQRSVRDPRRWASDARGCPVGAHTQPHMPPPKTRGQTPSSPGVRGSQRPTKRTGDAAASEPPHDSQSNPPPNIHGFIKQDQLQNNYKVIVILERRSEMRGLSHSRRSRREQLSTESECAQRCRSADTDPSRRGCSKRDTVRSFRCGCHRQL